MGELNYVDMIQTTIETNDGEGFLPIVNVQFELDVPVREDIYDYLIY